MRSTAILLAFVAIAIPTTAEAKRSKGDELAKLRAEIREMRRDLAAMQRRPRAPDPSTIVESILRFPPEGLGRLLPILPLIPVPTVNETPAPRTISTYRDALPGVSMARAPAPLQMWMRKVAGQCAGFKVISNYRPGARVRGSGRVSLHATARAVDFQVTSPSCAWAVLNRKGDRFPGGLSNDYARVRHFHVSWAKGSGEWSARFAHGGGKRYAKRAYAKRWKAKRSRYARRGRAG